MNVHDLLASVQKLAARADAAEALLHKTYTEVRAVTQDEMQAYQNAHGAVCTPPNAPADPAAPGTEAVVSKGPIWGNL